MLFRSMATPDPHALRKLLALNIRLRRVELDITQEELALRADLSQAYLSGIERSKRNPSIDTVQSIATALGIPAYELLKPRSR